MPYFYLKQRIPEWLSKALTGFNILMLMAQIVSPLAVMWVAQQFNNFYFTLFATQNYADFESGLVYGKREIFWLNFIVITQIVSGVILFISIV
jgi:hypothetical protein